MAAIVGIFSAIGVSFLSRETMMTPKKILKALENGAKNALTIATACACIGIIVSVITNTGLGLIFSTMIQNLARGNLLLIFVFSAIGCIILGMGVPTTPTYILVISIISPVLATVGVSLFASHFFVFYFAMIAAVTPPVCITAYAASNLAQSDPLKTGFTAAKLSFAGFLVPFLIVYNPALVLESSSPSLLIISVINSILIAIIFASVLQRWLISKLSFLEVFLLIANILLLIPISLSLARFSSPLGSFGLCQPPIIAATCSIPGASSKGIAIFSAGISIPISFDVDSLSNEPSPLRLSVPFLE